MNGWYFLIAGCLWYGWLAITDNLYHIISSFHRTLVVIFCCLLISCSVYFIINPIKLGTYTKNSLDKWNDNLEQIYKEHKCEGIFFVEDDCEIVYQKTTYYALKETDSVVNLDKRK